jgi:hypothetical protein
MSLKIYINEENQAFRKEGNNDALFGIQLGFTFKLPPIHGAVYSGSLTSATSVKLVQIKKDPPFEEVKETTLSNSVIKYENGEFKIDQDIAIGLFLDNCVYYLNFKNGVNEYNSEAFLVQVSNQSITWDINWITWDNDNITFDQTNIEI